MCPSASEICRTSGRTVGAVHDDLEADEVLIWGKGIFQVSDVAPGSVIDPLGSAHITPERPLGSETEQHLLGRQRSRLRSPGRGTQDGQDGQDSTGKAVP